MSDDVKHNGDPLGLGNAMMTEILAMSSLDMCQFLQEEGAKEEAREEAQGFLDLITWLSDHCIADVRREWLSKVIASVDDSLRELPEIEKAYQHLLSLLDQLTRDLLARPNHLDHLWTYDLHAYSEALQETLSQARPEEIDGLEFRDRDPGEVGRKNQPPKPRAELRAA